MVRVIATAGWSIPRRCAQRFSGEGTHLRRYSQVIRGAEIDTSFYRDHSKQTYANWARQTPRRFRFAVKLPRAITHDAHLRGTREPLARFLDAVSGLGQRLGPLVIQLAPSHPFEQRVVRNFLRLVRERHDGLLVCEPRHASWFDGRADRLLEGFEVGRVAADPAIVPAAAHPGGWAGIRYYRVHGSPRKYWSVYDAGRIRTWTDELRRIPRGIPVWFVFDNTAAGGALPNAMQMLEAL